MKKEPEHVIRVPVSKLAAVRCAESALISPI